MKQKILITGAAGFTGSFIARNLRYTYPEFDVVGIDNLSRAGSETNIAELKELGVDFHRGDIRNKEDMDSLPDCNWVIDCAAEPSVLAGLDGPSKLVGNNLTGTLNILEYCRKRSAGFILISTSRVYSINELNNLNLKEEDTRFVNLGKDIDHTFSTQAPISLYGGTKLASEIMALEYHHAFGIPVFINRCGVIAGPGQFGKIDQGIISFWIYQWMRKKPLKYIGFGGNGKQVRDIIHPADIFNLVVDQIFFPANKPNIINFGGGIENSISLKELSEWCRNKFGYDNEVIESDEERPFDIPYYVTDNWLVNAQYEPEPLISKETILNQIYDYAIENKEFVLNI